MVSISLERVWVYLVSKPHPPPFLDFFLANDSNDLNRIERVLAQKDLKEVFS